MQVDKWECYRKLKDKGYTPNFAVDAGYAVGEWTNGLKSVFGPVRVMGVEVHSELFNEFGAEIKEGYALWSVDGVELPFYCNDNSSGWCTGDSLFRENTQHYNDARVRIKSATTMTLNTLLRKHQINKVDILKLDIQGAELECLKGASDFLHDIDFVEIECATVQYNIGAPKLYDILEFMRTQFDVYDLLETHYSYGRYDLIQVDFLFKNKNLPLSMVI
jgi:FkbM family methyltransferase